LNLAALDNAVVRLKKSARAYDDAYAALLSRGQDLSAQQTTQLNAVLSGLERELTHTRGLPGRSWYRHYIYSPGLLTGYGVKTLPGVREAIEENQWERANQYAAFTAEVLTKYCDRLDQATKLLPR
jgi:N-acetylated-alpha-linked acidic dipeptidase